MIAGEISAGVTISRTAVSAESASAAARRLHREASDAARHGQAEVRQEKFAREQLQVSRALRIDERARQDQAVEVDGDRVDRASVRPGRERSIAGIACRRRRRGAATSSGCAARCLASRERAQAGDRTLCARRCALRWRCGLGVEAHRAVVKVGRADLQARRP